MVSGKKGPIIFGSCQFSLQTLLLERLHKYGIPALLSQSLFVAFRSVCNLWISSTLSFSWFICFWRPSRILRTRSIFDAGLLLWCWPASNNCATSMPVSGFLTPSRILCPLISFEITSKNTTLRSRSIQKAIVEAQQCENCAKQDSTQQALLVYVTFLTIASSSYAVGLVVIYTQPQTIVNWYTRPIQELLS